MTQKVKCHKCGHKWEYHGHHPYNATCSRCKSKIRVKPTLPPKTGFSY